MVETDRTKQTKIECTFKECTGCFVCKVKLKDSQSSKLETKATKWNKPKKQTQIECTFDGFVGCFICKAKSKSQARDKPQDYKKTESTQEFNGLSLGKSFADAVKQASKTMPIGSLSPDKKRDLLKGDATPNREVNGKLSAEDSDHTKKIIDIPAFSNYNQIKLCS